MTVKPFDDITPADEVLLGLDIGGWLDAIERVAGARPTIAGCTITCMQHPSSAVADAGAPARVTGDVTAHDDMRQRLFSGGVAGANYVISFFFELSDGQKRRWDVPISVWQILGIQRAP